jgi:hypothetical protein
MVSCLSTVMSLAQRYFYSIAGDTVDETVFIVDSARPPPGQIAFQRLRLAYACITVSLNVLHQLIDSLDCFPILRLPAEIIIPRLVVPAFNLRWSL